MIAIMARIIRLTGLLFKRPVACYNAKQCVRRRDPENVTFPAFTLAFILATLYGALFHLLAGGDARRLALYLITAWAGFALGQIIGTVTGIQMLAVGVLNLLSASVACWLGLVLVWALLRRRRLLA